MQLRTARVVRTARVGASFVRVTLAVDEPWHDLGWDQWVRAFLPRPTPTGSTLVIPHSPSTGWYVRWKMLPKGTRAEIRNETVRADRGHELDLDLVVHSGDDGAVAGPVGRWASTAAPGSTVGLLEQGTILDDALPVLRGPDPPDGPLVLLSDEAGLPAVEGVARSLPAGSRAVLLLEVPDASDQRELPSAADLDVRWVVRRRDAAPGRTALTVLAEVLNRRELPERALVAAIGETDVVGTARRLVQGRGRPEGQGPGVPFLERVPAPLTAP